LDNWGGDEYNWGCDKVFRMKQKNLRKLYPQFVYEDFSFSFKKRGVEILFFYSLKNKKEINFRHRIFIKNVKKENFLKRKDLLKWAIFNLGMIEILNYWKATSSPQIIIKNYYLDKNQIKWWKEIILKGMGQYFYENKLNWKEKNFLEIKCETKEKKLFSAKKINLSPTRYLVPIGGGKDSIVTIEKLKQKNKKIVGFLVNPTKFAKEVLKKSQIKEEVLVEREIDKTILKLNKQGFLNGHIPFTGVLSFLSVVGGVLFDCKNIVFSNEKSADEGNVKYLGEWINHQYSKTSEFERKFKWYVKKYIVKDLNYLNFLRNLKETEIAKEFLKYKKYFFSFSSCNNAKKTKKRWCLKCPKCLFVYSCLYPYLDKNTLLKMFETKKDLFEKKSLWELMKKLFLKTKIKPFECVGTKKETEEILKKCFKKAQKLGKIPSLLKKFNEIRKTQKKV